MLLEQAAQDGPEYAKVRYLRQWQPAVFCGWNLHHEDILPASFEVV